MLLRLQRNFWGFPYHEYQMGKIGSKTERCCRIQVSDTFMMSHHNFYWQTCWFYFSLLCIIWQIKNAMWQKWLGISIRDCLLRRLLYCICSIYKQETEDVLSTCALFKATNLSKTNHFTSQNTHRGSACLLVTLAFQHTNTSLWTGAPGQAAKTNPSFFLSTSRLVLQCNPQISGSSASCCCFFTSRCPAFLLSWNNIPVLQIHILKHAVANPQC